MSETPVQIHRWTRVQYDRLIEAGIFQTGDRVELLGGQICVSEPQNSPHATAICLAEEALRQAFAGSWSIRVQMPIALDQESEPEPDLTVAPGGPRDYLADHPARPVLVVEVSASSLALDREHKGSLYARARLRDYWIVNLVDRVVEVYREPGPDAAASLGWAYRSIQRLHADQSVTPLAAPTARIAVTDLLP
ncbi:MAG TPA: Uma2 family endonuclease [Methylomirabilota bacterium]